MSARAPRAPRPITPRRLENVALHYLERYASSAENLRRVLMRRVERAARAEVSDRAEGAGMVDALVARFVASGILDDAAYARGRAQSLFRAGKSARAIARTLRAKGVAAPDIDAALAALQQDHAAMDLDAALRYARRRRLGPWRRKDRDEHRRRDLAALGRQGFDYRTAAAVIDAEDEDAAFEILALQD